MGGELQLGIGQRRIGLGDNGNAQSRFIPLLQRIVKVIQKPGDVILILSCFVFSMGSQTMMYWSSGME